MKNVRWEISAGAVLLFALMYFFDGSGCVSALLPAVAVHELGHWIPLRLCQKPIRRVALGVFGLRIDYGGRLEGRRALACVGGGPAAGLVYALAACALGGDFWRMSGALSFVLSIFNLLPVLPLDGGRLIAAVTDARFAARLSRIAAALLTLGGAFIALRWHAFALLIAGIWLCIANFRSPLL